MRFLMTALLAGGVASTAMAANYDSRLYISPGVSYLISDPTRGTKDSDTYSLLVGLPVSDSRNYEIDLGWADLGATELWNLNANMLTFFDPNISGLYSVLSAGVLSSDGGPGSNYFSPNLGAGIGHLFDLGVARVRLEGMLRGDLHFDEKAGLGGKKAFIEPIFRLGFDVPLGPEPRADYQQEDLAVVDTAGNDSDGDGVEDASDLCPGTPLGTVVDGTGCAVSDSSELSPSDCREPALDEAVDEYGCAVDRTVVLNEVNFEFDSDQLTVQAMSTLDDVAQVLRDGTDATVEIAGHTSDEGDQFYNIDLSQRRADAVRQYLIDNGVDASRLQAKGYGGNVPIAPNNSADNRRENRRVEVKVVQ